MPSAPSPTCKPCTPPRKTSNAICASHPENVHIKIQIGKLAPMGETPHPDPLPLKKGERERGRHALLTSRLSLLQSESKLPEREQNAQITPALARGSRLARHRRRAGRDVPVPPGHHHRAVRGGRAIRQIGRAHL